MIIAVLKLSLLEIMNRVRGGNILSTFTKSCLTVSHHKTLGILTPRATICIPLNIKVKKKENGFQFHTIFLKVELYHLNSIITSTKSVSLHNIPRLKVLEYP